MRKLALNDQTMELVARRFRVLGERQRLRILQTLEAGPKSVSEIVASLEENQSNISRHLRALFECGILTRRRTGNNIYYSIADPMVFELCSLVCRSAEREARSKFRLLKTGRGRNIAAAEKAGE